MLLDDDLVELLHVMQTLRPGAGAQADEGADHLRDALRDHEDTDDGYHAFERPDRRAVRAVGRMLVDVPGRPEEMPAGVEEGEHAGKEEQEREDEINPRAPPQRP